MTSFITTAALRIAATLLPAIFIFAIATFNHAEKAHNVLYSYTLIAFVSLIARGGTETLIAQRYSNKYFVDNIWRSLLKTLIQASAVSFMLSFIFGLLNTESLELIFLQSICCLLFSSIWISLSFLHARGLGNIGVLLGHFGFYLLLVIQCFSAEEITSKTFSVIFIKSSIGVLLAMVWPMIKAFEAENRDAKFHSHFKSSFGLWFSNVSGRGKILFLQFALGMTLSAETFVELMVLFRFLEIPMAALVGTGFIARTYINHRQSKNIGQRKYFQLVRLSACLALISIIAIPIYIQLFGSNIEARILLCAWVMGFTLALLGPIAIVLDTIQQSNLVLKTRSLGIVILITLFTVSELLTVLNSASAIFIVFVVFSIEMLERLILRSSYKKIIEN